MNRRQRVYSNGTLVIEHAQRQADAGTYTCQAQNRQKHTARRDVEVQVIGDLHQPVVISVYPSLNLSLCCSKILPILLKLTPDCILQFRIKITSLLFTYFEDTYAETDSQCFLCRLHTSRLVKQEF